MNDEYDPLEAELLALRPLEVSPGLRRRVADRLAEAAPAKHRRHWRLAVAACVAAACLAAVGWWWASSRSIEPERIIVKASQPAAKVEEVPPTVQTYRLALARSPEALDALLDQQAVSAPESEPQPVQITALLRSESVLHALIGDD